MTQHSRKQYDDFCKMLLAALDEAEVQQKIKGIKNGQTDEEW